MPDDGHAVPDTARSQQPACPAPLVVLQRAVLAVLVLNLLLIAANVISYLPLLQQPGSILYILEPCALLVGYMDIVVAVTHRPTVGRQTAVHIGTFVGLGTGVLWVGNLANEMFRNGVGVASTAPILLGGFLLWGVAGWLTARRTHGLRSGITAAIWAAMVTVLLTVTAGFLLGLVAAPRLDQLMAVDPDFLRSGWPDRRVFAIANQFDSGVSHLLGGVIIGGLAGTLGAAVGRLQRQRGQVTS